MNYKFEKPIHAEIGTERFKVSIEWRNGKLVADEPVANGGKDLGPDSQQQPAKLFIETLEDSELLLIDYKSKEALFKKVPKFERLFRLMIQKAYDTMVDRLIANISKPAPQRYQDFIKKYPTLPYRSVCPSI